MAGDFETTFAGHPFTSIGKGEELRSAFSSYSVFDPGANVYDIYRHAKRGDPLHVQLMQDRECTSLPPGLRIFHINGDEVEQVLARLQRDGSDFGSGVNVAVPAWELPVYPGDWASALGRFDEIWAISRFVEKAVVDAGLRAHYIGQAVEIAPKPFLSRRYFDIRPSAFVFLTFLDLSSFPDRKNPGAAIEMYRRLRQQHPFADTQLVIKAKSGDASATEWVNSIRSETDSTAVFIDKPLTTYETQSLIAACDCFVSLHRSEGFGRGAAEAMWLGRAAIATGWSGNTDFMEGYPGAVHYSLTDVSEGQYPRHEGQVWAAPDVAHATEIAGLLLTSQAYARQLNELGQQQVRQRFSFRAVGLRMFERAGQLMDGRA